MAIRVGVLRGGPSSEYDISLITGQSILDNLSKDKYRPKDIFISKDGIWHNDGLPVDIDRLSRTIDVAVIAMHGKYGEDGQVQKLLEHFKIPYVGSRPAPSALAMNKIITKEIFRKNGIKTPFGININKDNIPDNIPGYVFSKMAGPWIVKPSDGGSSVGTTLVRNINDLQGAVNLAFDFGDTVMIEEFIKGREATCGVIDDFRGYKHYTLLPIEIIKPRERDFFDRQCKYDGTTREVCPGDFSMKDKKTIQELSLKIHNIMGLSHYSRSDFILSPRGIYALEVNTLPGLTPESLFPKALKAVGCGYDKFLDHLIELALNY